MKLDHKLNTILSLLADNICRKDYQHRGQVLDISESGLGMLTTVRLAPSTILEMSLVLPGQSYRRLDIAGEVIWMFAPGPREDSSSQYTVGIQFIDILPQEQDQIVHYIFQKQREEIRRRRDQD